MRIPQLSNFPPHRFDYPIMHLQHSNQPPYILPETVPRPLRVTGSQGYVPNWRDIKFSSLGLYQLRSWLGTYSSQLNFFKTNKTRFRASDIAYFAVGASTDDSHDHNPGQFHPDCVTFRRESTFKIGDNMEASREERKKLEEEVVVLLWDIATFLDRLTGGTTMIMRHGGTVIPGSPFLPEYLKARVYLPPAFISHNPDLHPAICDIVQHFIETVAVRTAERWSPRAKKSLNYSMTQKGRSAPNPSPTMSIPKPEEGTACYTFFGGPATHDSTFHASPAPAVAAFPRSISPSPSDSSDIYTIESFSGSDSMILDLQEEIRTLQKTNEELRIELQTAYDRSRTLEQQLLLARTSVPLSVTTSRHAPKTPIHESKKKLVHVETPSRQHFSYDTPSRSRTTPDPAASLRSPFAGAESSWGSRVLSPSLSSLTATDLFDNPTSPSLSFMLPAFLAQHQLSHHLTKIQGLAAYLPPEQHIGALVGMGLPEAVSRTIAAVIAIDAATLQSFDNEGA